MTKDILKVSAYLLAGSKKDLEVAEFLFKKKYYSQCLFFCHLTLEKLLKAVLIKRTKKFAPFTHDLKKLAELIGLALPQKQKDYLDEISVFNIAGRYAEEKMEFYEKYNKKDYASRYLKITVELYEKTIQSEKIYK